MKRHIVVEGMDGTGKTGLITALVQSQLGLTFVLHERASTSLGGPVSELDRWTFTDIDTMATQPRSIYDRHPIISEPIYGPICRGRVPGRFAIGHWVSRMEQQLTHHAVVVWCIPPWLEVERNVTEGNHMEGVRENARRLYEKYRRTARSWDGTSIMYDYTTHDKNVVVQHLAMATGSN